MSIKLCQAAGSTVTPLDDARLYSWIANRTVGIVTGCDVEIAGTNQLSISSGWGICQGHVFTISAETIAALLPTSGTVPGRLLIHIDTSDTDTPVAFVTQTAGTLPGLTQEDIDGSGSIYEIPLATYSAGTLSISGLTHVAPSAKAPSIGLSYSTSETDTGKTWIDGKKIYRKTLSVVTAAGSTDASISTGLTGISTGWFAQPSFGAFAGTILPIPYANGEETFEVAVYSDDGFATVRIKSQNLLDGTKYVTIEYTKA